MIAFTICSRNFLAQAQVLHDGLRRHHPDLRFHLALCDEIGELEEDALPFPLIRLDQLGIPDLEGMVGRYNISELNTAIKPFVFAWLFSRNPGETIRYFDPDIAVVSPLRELEALLAGGADCVLTPHLCEPAEFAEMNGRRLLRYGIYNLGFCALRDTEEVRRVVAWWGRRLERECVIDLEAGLFVDQKWATHFPAFIEKTSILRHPGYNVAYWNLSQRTVRRLPAGWEVNGMPLRFFHFSGSAVDEPLEFSRHSEEFRLDTLRDVRRLFLDYVAQVRRFGRRHYRAIPYAFSWEGPGGPNPHAPRASADRASGPGAPRGGLAKEGAAPHLPLLRARTLDEYRVRTATIPEAIGRRRALEEALVPGEAGTFAVEAHCAVCGTSSSMSCDSEHPARTLADGRPLPNWREQLACAGCGLTNRFRACLHLLHQELSPRADARIYATEMVTPLFRWLEQRFPAIVGSEYLGEGRSPGEVVGGIRHEDLQALSFRDSSFDLVLSFEVLEHLPDVPRALGELARVLRPGGWLFLTAPFSHDSPTDIVRAVRGDDGTLTHLLPPEHHGNPVAPGEGSLCLRYFGWSLLDDLRRAGFVDAEAWFYWSRQLGYLGDTNTVIVARRDHGGR